LSLSIGAISLVITNNQSSSSSDINKNILQFLFVFIILITSWIIYTSDMSVLPIETRLVQLLNVLLLMLVATIPYLFDQVVSTFNSSSVQNYASILFTSDYAGTLLIMAVFSHIIAQEEEHLVDGEIMIRMRRVRNRLSILTVIVLLSLAAPWDWLFLGVHVRLYIWLVPIISFWFNRMRRSPFGLPRDGDSRPGLFDRGPGPAK
jgi:hypothetical protein